MPVTTSPLFERLFELVPGREALGLVARQPRFAVAVFERLDRDGDEVAGLDFDFAASFLNSSSGMKLSDLRPALTTTML